MLDTSTGRPTCLGVPFDFDGDPAQMDWFEDVNNLDPYQQLVSERDDLRQYLAECGIVRVTRSSFERIRDERRILYHAMVAAGASIYVGEPWHYNWPTSTGEYPNAGNGCHSLLKNVRGPDGDYLAVWSNDFGNAMASDMLGISLF